MASDMPPPPPPFGPLRHTRFPPRLPFSSGANSNGFGWLNDLLADKNCVILITRNNKNNDQTNQRMCRPVLQMSVSVCVCLCVMVGRARSNSHFVCLNINNCRRCFLFLEQEHCCSSALCILSRPPPPLLEKTIHFCCPHNWGRGQAFYLKFSFSHWNFEGHCIFKDSSINTNNPNINNDNNKNEDNNNES